MSAHSLAEHVPHVYRAIAAVKRELSRTGIDKSRKNTVQNFCFRGIDDIFNRLAPLLAANDLLIVPRVVGHERSEYETSKKTAMFRVVVIVNYEILSLADGSTLGAVIPFIGEGTDQGDKATSKALSMAFKYFAIQTFAIPVEGQDDADTDSPEDASPGSERRMSSTTTARPAAALPPVRTNRAYADAPETLFTELTVEGLDAYHSWLKARLRAKLTELQRTNVENHIKAIDAEMRRRLDNEAAAADAALGDNVYAGAAE